MQLFHDLFHTLRHFSPQTLGDFAHHYQNYLYFVLCAIVFCETGLVVMPFLPGDSLLFATGVVAAHTPTIHLPVLALMLCLAANAGDLLNYTLGYSIGPKIFASPTSRWLNKKHLAEAHAFYEKYGRKTIILARFVPIVRTFAPFVAGIGDMGFLRFAAFSVVGGALWVTLCLTAGYRLASVKFLQSHFDLVIVAIVAVSVLPTVIHVIQARRRSSRPERRPA